MVEKLYQSLRTKGISLRTAKTHGDIEVSAPQGVMTDELRVRLRSCKGEMYDYLLTVEEQAAILEIEQGNTPRLAEVLAVKAVNHRRSCEREDALRGDVRLHPQFQILEADCWRVLGCGLEIVGRTGGKLR